MAWNDLTLSDKARMINLAVRSGITNLRDIQEVYNKYKEGGNKKSAIVPEHAYSLWEPETPEEEKKYEKNRYVRISSDRYNTAFNALREAGYNGFDSDRLAQILATQSIGETGWVDKNDTHNYAGYLDSNGKLIKYSSPEEFWRAHINNLTNRWPEWSNSQNIPEYFSTINNTALGLTTKEKFDAYNRAHRDNPAYIYAPDWENTDYLKKMLSIDKRAKKNYTSRKGPLFD